MYIADYKKKGTVSKYPFFLPFFFCVPLGCFFLLLPVRKREKIPPTKWNPLLSGSLELVSPLQDFTSYSCSGDSDLWWSVSFSESKRFEHKGYNLPNRDTDRNKKMFYLFKLYFTTNHGFFEIGMSLCIALRSIMKRFVFICPCVVTTFPSEENRSEPVKIILLPWCTGPLSFFYGLAVCCTPKGLLDGVGKFAMFVRLDSGPNNFSPI